MIDGVDKMQIIVFTLKDEYYAINTELVEEISRNITSTFVPKAPQWVEGLINLRGNVVTLVNLSKLLHKEEGQCYNNIVIINKDEEKIGLLVTSVVEVIDVEMNDIEKINTAIVDGIKGIIQLDGHIVNIVDIGILLAENEG